MVESPVFLVSHHALAGVRGSRESCECSDWLAIGMLEMKCPPLLVTVKNWRGCGNEINKLYKGAEERHAVLRDLERRCLGDTYCEDNKCILLLSNFYDLAGLLRD